MHCHISHRQNSWASHQGFNINPFCCAKIVCSDADADALHVAVGHRELGCTCEKAAGDAASPMKQYKVTLLPASAKQPPRTLAEMFPKLQLARARAKK